MVVCSHEPFGRNPSGLFCRIPHGHLQTLVRFRKDWKKEDFVWTAGLIPVLELKTTPLRALHAMY
jgi:hypothetical protein